MDRVLVAGISGAGKTTLVRRISQRLGLPRYELDALHHGPGWVKRPEFEADVERFSSTPRWVTEDQYHSFLGDLLWQRADTVVWLDLPRRIVMSRVIRRSVGRAITRRELWNGNREDPRTWVRPDHPIRFSWSNYQHKRTRVRGHSERNPDVAVIRLTSATAVRQWFAGLSG